MLILFPLTIAVTAQVSAQTPAPKQAPAATPFRDLFIELDANNDRVIERSEVPESARKAFDQLLSHGDSNHDEKLQAEEFRDLLLKVDWRRSVPLEQRERRFKNLDRNGNGKLERDEFPGGPGRFKQLDRNGDGFLSRDEIPWLDPDGASGNAGPKKPKS